MGINRVVKVLVDQGEDLDAQCDDGFCALHRAWDAEVVNLLVNAGAKVDLMACEGYTPRFQAARICNVGGILTLLRHGAQVNLKEKEDGYTPLHSLCEGFQASSRHSNSRIRVVDRMVI